MLLPLPDNACALCGRRSAASGVRDNPACTGKCVRGGLTPRDYALESALLLELSQQPAGTRMSLERALVGQVAFDGSADAQRARNAARRLAARGQLELLQAGQVVGVESDDAGPLEVRLPSR